MSGIEDEENRKKNDEDKDLSAAAERRLTIFNNVIQSRDLFLGTREIVIVHGRDAYHLRLTSQNKLILTK